MRRKPITTRLSERGFALILTLFLTMLLLVLGLAMLDASQFSSLSTQNVERKHNSFNAAEAGLNTAIDKLDASVSYSASNTQGTLSNSYTYTYSVINRLALSDLQTTDPVTGEPITIPASRALIVSTGQGPNGERPTTVEVIVKLTESPFIFPNDAIDAGLDIAGYWNYRTGVGGSAPGKNDANVHANHNITATIGFLQGIATASGTTDSLNSAPTGVGTPQVVLPTSIMPAFVTYEKSIAQAGGPYATYIAAGTPMPSTYNCPPDAPASGCVVFYDGSLHISGDQTVAFTGHVTFVVNGDYSATGQSQLSFESGTKSLFVVNGNSDDGGLAAMGALIWAKGDVTLHGNGYQIGKIVAGGNVFFKGGGSSGGFQYDPSLGNFRIDLPGHIVMLTYGEY